MGLTYRIDQQKGDAHLFIIKKIGLRGMPRNLTPMLLPSAASISVRQFILPDNLVSSLDCEKGERPLYPKI